METTRKFICIGCPSLGDRCYPENRSRCSKRPPTGNKRYREEEPTHAEYTLDNFASGEFAGWSDYKFLWAMGIDLHPDTRE